MHMMDVAESVSNFAEGLTNILLITWKGSLQASSTPPRELMTGTLIELITRPRTLRIMKVLFL